jgi:apolipoprotein N-acyltransferase
MSINLLLNNRFIIIFFAPLLLGAFTVFTFQPFNITFLNFIIIPLLFLILAYVRKKSRNIYRKKPFLKNLFFIGYFFGIGFFFTGTYWISYSLTFDENFRFLIPFSLILIPLFLGTFFGVATLVSGYFIKNNIHSILIFCSSFALMDFLRSKILTGFPWNLWAYSWSWFPEILQILNPIGLFAFNLLTLTIFCAPLFIVVKKTKLGIFIFFLTTLMFFFNYIYGSFVLNKSESIAKNNNQFLNIKVVSPNFNLKYNLSIKDLDVLLDNLIKYSEPAKNKKTIFIWPEGVFAGHSFDGIKNFKNKFQKHFSKDHIIILGVNTVEENPYKIYNSLIAVNNNFEIIYQYNKIKLVPFGEFLPLEKYFYKFGLKKITEGVNSFSNGTIQKNFKHNNANILPLICYEIIFTDLIQKIDKDTNLIINISEDAWFGGSIGPYQHFSKAIFRAIESNIFIARSANQGVSAFISNNGLVIKNLKPNERGNIEYNIPILANKIRNKNDLIFFILLITYVFIFFILRKLNNDKK